MSKDTKKRTIVYSNVKENKQKKKEYEKISEDQINLSDEFIIGLKGLPSDIKEKDKKLKGTKEKDNKQKGIKEKDKKTKGIKEKDKKKKNIKEENKKQKDIKSKKQITSRNENIKPKMSSRKKKKIKAIIRISITFFILASIVITGFFVFFKSSIFNVKEISIKISNNNNLTESKIKDLSNINIGQNMYSIKKKTIMENIKKDSYVQSVKVKRSLPSKFVIEIEERQPAYQLNLDSQFIYIDNQGYILEKSETKLNCIVLTGFSSKNLENGNKLEEKDVKALSAVSQIIQEANNIGIGDKLTSINIENPNNYVLVFESLGKNAHIGNTKTLTDKMTYIKKIFEEEDGIDGDIFVNVDFNKGEYPYFREKV